MKAIGEKALFHGSNAWGADSPSYEQEFEIEAKDVGRTSPNYGGCGYLEVIFRQSDVGRKIIVHTKEKSSWTCWVWASVNFENSHKALAHYDEVERPRLDKLLDCADTNERFKEYQDQRDKAIEAVQHEFWRDTDHVNNRNHCRSADLYFIRKCVANAQEKESKSQ